MSDDTIEEVSPFMDRYVDHVAASLSAEASLTDPGVAEGADLVDGYPDPFEDA